MGCSEFIEKKFPRIWDIEEAEQLAKCYPEVNTGEKYKIVEILLRTLKTSYVKRVGTSTEEYQQAKKRQEHELKEADRKLLKSEANDDYVPSYLVYEQTESVEEERKRFEEEEAKRIAEELERERQRYKVVSPGEEFTQLSVSERLKKIEARRGSGNVDFSAKGKSQSDSTTTPRSYDYKSSSNLLEIDSPLGMRIVELLEPIYLNNQIPEVFNGLVIFLDVSHNPRSRGKVTAMINAMVQKLKAENPIFVTQLKEGTQK